MENTEKKRFTGIKITMIVTGAFLLAFLVYYTILSALAPARKLDEIKTRIGLKQTSDTNTDERYYSDSAFISLSKKFSYTLTFKY